MSHRQDQAAEVDPENQDEEETVRGQRSEAKGTENTISEHIKNHEAEEPPERLPLLSRQETEAKIYTDSSK